jgi:hypothetical protein
MGPSRQANVPNPMCLWRHASEDYSSRNAGIGRILSAQFTWAAPASTTSSAKQESVWVNYALLL